MSHRKQASASASLGFYAAQKIPLEAETRETASPVSPYIVHRGTYHFSRQPLEWQEEAAKEQLAGSDRTPSFASAAGNTPTISNKLSPEKLLLLQQLPEYANLMSKLVGKLDTFTNRIQDEQEGSALPQQHSEKFMALFKQAQNKKNSETATSSTTNKESIENSQRPSPRQKIELEPPQETEVEQNFVSKIFQSPYLVFSNNAEQLVSNSVPSQNVTHEPSTPTTPVHSCKSVSQQSSQTNAAAISAKVERKISLEKQVRTQTRLYEDHRKREAKIEAQRKSIEKEFLEQKPKICKHSTKLLDDSYKYANLSKSESSSANSPTIKSIVERLERSTQDLKFFKRPNLFKVEACTKQGFANNSTYSQYMPRDSFRSHDSQGKSTSEYAETEREEVISLKNRERSSFEAQENNQRETESQVAREEKKEKSGSILEATPEAAIKNRLIENFFAANNLNEEENNALILGPQTERESSGTSKSENQPVNILKTEKDEKEILNDRQEFSAILHNSRFTISNEESTLKIEQLSSLAREFNAAVDSIREQESSSTGLTGHSKNEKSGSANFESISGSQNLTNELNGSKQETQDINSASSRHQEVYTNILKNLKLINEEKCYLNLKRAEK